MTSLGCAAAPQCSLLCQGPVTRLLHHFPHPRILCSLCDNNIGPEGAIKLAEVLIQTKINILKCAAAPCVCLSVMTR